MLACAFGDRVNGFYVGIGACVPNVASATRYSYELGWNGVNVEPMARRSSGCRRSARATLM